MHVSAFHSDKISTPRDTRSHAHDPLPQSHAAKAGMPVYLQTGSDQGTYKSGSPYSGLGAAIGHARQSGSGLPDHARHHFESALGTDLTAVRVHTGTQHNQIARSLKAKALTTGSDIFFGQGYYRPGTRDGDRLLAHELAHVVQQSSGDVPAGGQIEPGLTMGEAKDAHEQEADQVADSLVSGREPGALPGQGGQEGLPPAGREVSGAVIQRDEEEEEQGFDYSVLPPELSYRTGPFGISADTSSARLNLFSDQGRASLGYQYGGDIFYGASLGDFRTRFGVNPQTGVGSMSLGGSHGDFRYGLRGSTAGTFGLSLGYGAPLLPMPGVLGQQAGAAWEGASAVGGAVPEFASDPMAAYEAYRDQIGAMGAFGRSLSRIYGQQGEGGLPFGAGLTLSYNPEQEWVLGAGIQGSF